MFSLNLEYILKSKLVIELFYWCIFVYQNPWFGYKHKWKQQFGKYIE